MRLRFASLSLCVFTACVPTLTVDGGLTDAGADGRADARSDARNDAAQSLAVVFVSPLMDASTNGSLPIQLDVTGVPSGATGASVELDLDGRVLATLSAPYRYVWDTRAVAEGRHVLLARVTYNGDAAMSDVRTVTVDRSPPTVLSRVPAPGSNNVFMRDPIVVTFSEPIRATTITDASLLLTYPDPSGTSLAKTWTLSPDGKTLRITVTGTLPVGFFPTAISASLTSAVMDMAGNTLNDGAGWNWQVPDWALVAQNLHVVGPGSYQPDVAFDPLMNVPVVAWTEGQLMFSTTDRVEIHVERRVNAQWEAIGGAISAHPASPHAMTPRLAVSPLGVYVLSWVEPENSDPDAGPIGDNRVHVARWDGTTWRPLGGALALGAAGIDTTTPQAVALDPLGDPTVAWIETDPGTGASSVIVEQYSSAANTWTLVGAPQRASGSSNTPSYPSLTYSRTGELFLSWSEVDAGTRSVFVRHLADSAWSPLASPEVPLQPSPLLGQGQVDQPALALNSAGQPVIASNYLAAGAPSHVVYIAQWDPTSSGWKELGTRTGDTASGGETIFPHLAMSGDVPWIVFAETASGGGQQAFVQQRLADATWRAIGAPLSAQRPTPARIVLTPRIALDRNDHAMVAWSQESPTADTDDTVYVALQNY